MFTSNKILVITLLASFASSLRAEEITSVEKHVVESNPAETAILTQLVVQDSASPYASYSYKCTAGSYISNRLACTAADSTSWGSPRNVELKLRCPRSGSGLTLSYVEINFVVSSASVNCFVNEGAVGLGYIGMTVQAWNTLVFNYSAKFYSR